MTEWAEALEGLLSAKDVLCTGGGALAGHEGLTVPFQVGTQHILGHTLDPASSVHGSGPLGATHVH